MSRKYATPERRIPQRRKPIECQYPKCKKEATHSLGLDDPDSEPNYYCKKHCEKAKMNTIMNIADLTSSRKSK